MGLLGIEPWGRALRAVSNHYAIFIFSIDSHYIEVVTWYFGAPTNLNIFIKYLFAGRP